MTERNLWVFCLAAGVATLVMAIVILPMFPADAAGDIQPYVSPIYAFEFARTSEDLIAVFGNPDDPLRAQRLLMMDRGNRWDFLFMALYTSFGALFGLAARSSGLSMGVLIVAFAAVAGIADVLETSLLLSISEVFAIGREQGTALEWLWLPVMTKFIAIGLTILLAGISLWRARIQPWRAVGGALVVLGTLCAVYTLGVRGFAVDAGTAIGLGWALMLTYAAIRSTCGPIRLRQ